MRFIMSRDRGLQRSASRILADLDESYETLHRAPPTGIRRTVSQRAATTLRLRRTSSVVLPGAAELSEHAPPRVLLWHQPPTPALESKPGAKNKIRTGAVAHH